MSGLKTAHLRGKFCWRLSRDGLLSFKSLVDEIGATSHLRRWWRWLLSWWGEGNYLGSLSSILSIMPPNLDDCNNRGHVQIDHRVDRLILWTAGAPASSWGGCRNERGWWWGDVQRCGGDAYSQYLRPDKTVLFRCVLVLTEVDGVGLKLQRKRSQRRPCLHAQRPQRHYVISTFTSGSTSSLTHSSFGGGATERQGFFYVVNWQAMAERTASRHTCYVWHEVSFQLPNIFRRLNISCRLNIFPKLYITQAIAKGMEAE